MSATIHGEMPKFSRDGLIYCRARDKRVPLDTRQFRDFCDRCPYLAGSCQGEGVECLYDERKSAAIFKDREEKRNPLSAPDGLIEGRNAVTEALRAGMPVNKVWLLRGEDSGALRRIAALAKEAGAVVAEADRRKLDAMSVTGAHQGVIALAAATKYAEVADLLRVAEERGEKPLLVVCDEISDPHNLGAIIRSAECAGAHGVIIPKRRSAGVTAVVAKASAGATAHLPIARVPNIPTLLKDLKKRGLWIYGADASGAASLYETDWTGPAALVIGSEGAGMTRLAAEQCDFLVRIPMKGHINSLNASTACAVLLYEALRQRINLKGEV